MIARLLLLAQVFDPLNPAADVTPSKGFNLTMRDTLLVITVVFALSLLLFLVVYISRGKRRHRLHRGGAERDSSHSHRPHTLHRDEHEEGSESGRHGRRRRRRRSEDLPRRPTLAEAGGLPPARPEEPAGPPA